MKKYTKTRFIFSFLPNTSTTKKRSSKHKIFALVDSQSHSVSVLAIDCNVVEHDKFISKLRHPLSGVCVCNAVKIERNLFYMHFSLRFIIPFGELRDSIETNAPFDTNFGLNSSLFAISMMIFDLRSRSIHFAFFVPHSFIRFVCLPFLFPLCAFLFLMNRLFVHFLCVWMCARRSTITIIESNTFAYIKAVRECACQESEQSACILHIYENAKKKYVEQQHTQRMNHKNGFCSNARFSFTFYFSFRKKGKNIVCFHFHWILLLLKLRMKERGRERKNLVKETGMREWAKNAPATNIWEIKFVFYVHWRLYILR